MFYLVNLSDLQKLPCFLMFSENRYIQNSHAIVQTHLKYTELL